MQEDVGTVKWQNHKTSSGVLPYVKKMSAGAHERDRVGFFVNKMIVETQDFASLPDAFRW
jgi:hypothetical protein